jgi:hypothetical protein
VVAGVLNGALLPAEELAKFPDGWNGRPIPIYHPTDNGQNISANHPDVLERCVGKVFNCTFDGDRLRAEFWLDEQRMDTQGQAPLLAAIQSGQMIEVSTGYFCDMVATAGEFNGKPYKGKQANLRPDHVALLPNQTGACSIHDGCGAPRVHQRADTVDKNAVMAMLKNLGAALGISTNCSCEGSDMKPTAKEIATLATNLQARGVQIEGMATNFNIADLEALSETGRAALYGALKALEKAAMKPPAGEGGEGEESGKKPAANAQPQGITVEQLGTMIGNAVRKEVGALKSELLVAGRRADVTARLLANSANTLTEAELQAMSVESLEKIDKALRPTDFSGAAGGPGVGGFSANESAPLVSPAALFAPVTKQ